MLEPIIKSEEKKFEGQTVEEIKSKMLDIESMVMAIFKSRGFDCYHVRNLLPKWADFKDTFQNALSAEINKDLNKVEVSSTPYVSVSFSSDKKY